MTSARDLIKGLSATKKQAASASGGDVATFAELSEIASSAGQPELVYKLMELSAASSVWNTRKGVAFALAGRRRVRDEEGGHGEPPAGGDGVDEVQVLPARREDRRAPSLRREAREQSPVRALAWLG